MCSSNKFPRDADASGPGAILKNHKDGPSISKQLGFVLIHSFVSRVRDNWCILKANVEY